MINRGLNFTIKKFDQISAIILAFLVLYITCHTILRYLFGYGMPSVYPITQVCLAIIVFLSIPQAQVQKEHVRITYFTDKLRGPIAKAIDFLVHLAAIAFLLGMTWGGWVSLMYSISVQEVYTGTINISVLPARVALVIGSLFFLIRIILDLIQRIHEP